MKHFSRLLLLLTASFLLYTPIAALADSKSNKTYLCITEQATGFRYDSSTSNWVQANFHPESKWLVTPNERGDGYLIKQFGHDSPSYHCDQPIDEYGWLKCEGIGEFAMRLEKMRFQAYYQGSYVAGIEENERLGRDTPSIEIGTCTGL